jgi:hypothetical protein
MALRSGSADSSGSLHDAEVRSPTKTHLVKLLTPFPFFYAQNLARALEKWRK